MENIYEYGIIDTKGKKHLFKQSWDGEDLTWKIFFC